MADNTSTHSSFEAPGTLIANDTAYEFRLWKHMPGDMVLEPVFYCPMLINNSGICLEQI